eukprot:CAMPEP_0184238330 /NCGR_PEP_ID=MMETSP0976-20121227/26808_1 /TAXON_ID=483370 /ORGANISM="non described non described, Strain CCMP2097" /LENGTH=61 /DNA_ID=CAMNT_0026543499 /DNA_START=1 /DNA_END=183 /DNA_ORIENTATION=-
MAPRAGHVYSAVDRGRAPFAGPSPPGSSAEFLTHLPGPGDVTVHGSAPVEARGQSCASIFA